jgi:hypothetical protein
MNHRVGSVVFGLGIGLLVAAWSYQWITAPEKREQRAEEEAVVMESRIILEEKLDITGLEVVDPLAPQRKVGKVYVYPLDGGWEVSGFYRRGEGDRWHAYLLTLSADLELTSMKVKDADPRLEQVAASDSLIEVLP